MTSENSQSTRPTDRGSSAKALSWRSSTLGRRETEGSSGALSTLSTCAPSRCSTQVQPPGLGAEIEAEIAATGALVQQREQLPQLEIGAARRGAVLDELRLAVGERARAMGRDNQRGLVDQGPGSKRVPWAQDRRTAAAWPRPWASAPRSARRGDDAQRNRAPSCAGSRAACWPRRRSRRSSRRSDRARHSLPRRSASPAPAPGSGCHTSGAHRFRALPGAAAESRPARDSRQSQQPYHRAFAALPTTSRNISVVSRPVLVL